jgi:hypothetical protein
MSKPTSTSDSNKFDQTFASIRQTQVSLLKSVNKKNLQNYYDKLVELFENENDKRSLEPSKEDSTHLAQFFLIPILHAIRKQASSSTSSSDEGKDGISNDCAELQLKCIALVLRKLKLTEAFLFYEILSACSIVISKKLMPTQTNKTNAQIQASEELCMACFNLIEALFAKDNCSTNSLRIEFYMFRNLTMMGLLVSTLLETLNASGSLAVRMSSLDALKSLVQYSDDGVTQNEKGNQQQQFPATLGIMLASFLPGIALRLVQSFLLEQNLNLLNHKLVCASLELLGHVISIVFDDRLLDELYFARLYERANNIENNSVSMSNSSGTFDAASKNAAQIRSMLVDRVKNKDWLRSSSEKLFMLVDRLLAALLLVDNAHVHMSLIKFCARIANECFVSLNEQIGSLLKVLVTFAADENKDDDYYGNDHDDSIELGKTARQAINVIKKRQSIDNDTGKFLVLVNANVDELLLRLPRLLNSENRTTISLKTLLGYMKLIGDTNLTHQSLSQPSLKHYFHANETTLARLLGALVECVRFDHSNLDNFYSIEASPQLAAASSASCSDALSNYSGMRTYVQDKNTLEQLSRLCNYLGSSDAVYMLVDELLSSGGSMIAAKQKRPEAMLLINLLVSGLSDNINDISNLQLIDFVLSDFMSEMSNTSADLIEIVQPMGENEAGRHRNRHLHHSLDNQHSFNTIERNRRIIQICLTLESIAICSKKSVGCKDVYNRHLIETLYFMLENYLSANLLVRAAATRCMRMLVENMAYSNMQELLAANYDYIVNDLILKSYKAQQKQQKRQKQQEHQEHQEHQEYQEQHVLVLCSLLDIASSGLVPYLERLVDDYCSSVDLLASSPQSACFIAGICQVMLQMSKSMRRWYPIKYAEQSYISMSENYADNDDGARELLVDLSKFASMKRKDDYNKSLEATLHELDNALDEFNAAEKNAFAKSPNDSEQMTTDCNGQDDNNNEDEGDSSKKSPPLHIKLQSKCVELCKHLISHPSKHIRIKVIDLVGELLNNLIEHTDEFLPLVHKLWSPMCQRFAYDDLIVKTKLVALLFRLSALCPEFLSSRFVKELLPRLCSFMSEQAALSLKANINSKQVGLADPTYVYSHAFKLQCGIMANLDKMCVLFEIRSVELEKLIETVMFAYLDKRQPKRLQSLTLDALRKCSLIDADTVWLCMHYLMPFANAHAQAQNDQERRLKQQLEVHSLDESFYSSRIKSKQHSHIIQLSDETIDALVELFSIL